MKTIETFSIEKNFSFPNAGISMRFVHSDGGASNLISQFEDKEHAKQLFVSAEFLEFRDFNAKGETNGPRDAFRKELLQLLVSKHAVKFHLGKNDDSVLTAEPSYANSADQYRRFQSVVKEADPKGMFMSDFVSQLLRVRSGQ